MAEHGAEPESEAEGGPEGQVDSGSAAALALGLTHRRGRSGADPKLDAFLDEQTDLIRLQKEHLHEQRELQLAHLRVRRWRDRLALGMQFLGIVVGAAAVIALAVVVWQAHEDRGLVIEAFSVPPDLAQRGLTGQVAAAKVLDKLAALQAQTDSARAPSTYTNNWGDDLKVEIPETGVSVGELNRYLRQWLGRETHISGEVVRTPAGVSVTARTDAEPGVSFDGPETDLDALFQKAAEALYARTQPYRYGAFLLTRSRFDEARATFQTLEAKGDKTDRKWAEVGLANIPFFSGDLLGAEHEHNRLTRMDPTFVMAVTNVASDAANLDHEQELLESARQSIPLFPGDANSQVTPIAARALALSSRASVLEMLGDYQAALRPEADLVEAADYGGSSAAAVLQRSIDLTFNHQPSAALAALAEAHAPAGLLPVYVLGFQGQVANARLVADVVREDWAGAGVDGDKSVQLLTAAGGAFSGAEIARNARPWLAYAKARAGDIDAAEALIAQTPTDGDTALRLRGKIAAAKGDWAGAEGWFRQAVRQAPSIPFAYADWGEMLLARGDLDGAIVRLQQANQKGPHYADALELWGEALMRKRDYSGAAARFAEADKYAPRWGRNHLRWGQALARTGKADDAKAQWIAAAGMDLSPADRAELVKAR